MLAFPWQRHTTERKRPQEHFSYLQQARRSTFEYEQLCYLSSHLQFLSAMSMWLLEQIRRQEVNTYQRGSRYFGLD